MSQTLFEVYTLLATEFEKSRNYLNPNAWPMPDSRFARDLLARWQAKYGEGHDPKEFYVVAAIAMYSPPGLSLSWQRLWHVRDYVQKWKTRFQVADLPQLVFCYALGIQRAAAHFDGEETAWNEIWPDAHWALVKYLDDLERWACRQLVRCGILLHPPGASVEAAEARGDNQQDGLQLPGVFAHASGVLLEQTKCNCVAEFVKHHPRARAAAIRRHSRYHLLASWLNKQGWPKSQQYKRIVYPVARFLFRALVGDRPQHAKDFEKGLLCLALRGQGTDLRLVKCGRCSKCRRVLASPNECQHCNVSGPSVTGCLRIIRDGDPSWHEAQVARCACGRIFAADQIPCNACPASRSADGEIQQFSLHFFQPRGAAPAPATDPADPDESGGENR